MEFIPEFHWVFATIAFHTGQLFDVDGYKPIICRRFVDVVKTIALLYFYNDLIWRQIASCHRIHRMVINGRHVYTVATIQTWRSYIWTSRCIVRHVSASTCLWEFQRKNEFGTSTTSCDLYVDGNLWRVSPEPVGRQFHARITPFFKIHVIIYESTPGLWTLGINFTCFLKFHSLRSWNSSKTAWNLFPKSTHDELISS